MNMIGKRPNTAPSTPASSACPTGIEYTMIATRIETASEISAAHCALIRNPPSSTKSTTSGRAANIDERPSESDTGS